MPIKHKEETPTQALAKDIQNNLSVIKDDIVASSQENVINGENLDDFIYHHFLNRLDPVEYCENVLRHHLPESRQKLHENQTALIRAVCNPKLKQVAGMMSRQSGKCFAKGTKILMADGSRKNVEDIKIGDYVMSPTSEPRLVTNLGHGFEEMYEIIPNQKGYSSFTVNKSHILSLIDHNKNQIRGTDILNINVEEYNKLPKYKQERLLGYRSFVEYKEKPIQVDPYYLGLWIGDGRASYPEITNVDKEVIEYIYRYAKQLGLQVTIYNKNNPNRTNSYAITQGIGATKNDKNKLKKMLKSLNLINNKHIPDEIMFNSIKIRREFLAGLIDTDGSKEHKFKKNQTKINSHIKELAYQIRDLCRSIGLKAQLREKLVKLNDKTFVEYPVYIYGDLSVIPTKVKRKQFSNSLHKNPLYFGFKVKSKGIGEYFGFTIDSPDHLFLLGDYTVTHNTESISSFCGFLIDNYPQMRVGVFTPRLQQAEVSIGRLSTFFQMNEDRLNNKIVKLTKDRIELSNKSYVTAVSASDQSNIEGLTFDVIVLDEAQKVSDYTFSERIVPMGN